MSARGAACSTAPPGLFSDCRNRHPHRPGMHASRDPRQPGTTAQWRLGLLVARTGPSLLATVLPFARHPPGFQACRSAVGELAAKRHCTLIRPVMPMLV